MLMQQRFDKILELLEEKEVIYTRDTARLLQVTETTIRRDFEAMEKQKRLVRVHGGAKRRKDASGKTVFKIANSGNIIKNEAAKAIICKKAAELVKDGDCIYLDGGTSLVPLIKYLKGKRVRIVTPSLLVANAFDDLNSELYMVGGKYYEPLEIFIGPSTINNIERFKFDHVFLSCYSIDLESQDVYVSELDTMQIKEAAMRQGENKCLLVDASKIAIGGFYAIMHLSDFDTIITNESDTLNEEALPSSFIVAR